jgi:hypothetical protein
MAGPNPLPILALGAAALFMMKPKAQPTCPPPKVPPRPEESSPGIPPLGLDEVGFSKDAMAYEMGNGWTIRVLDAWLDKERNENRILMMPANEPGMEASRLEAADRFSTTHHVKVAIDETGSPFYDRLISDLPDTEAVQEFRAQLLNYIDRFQHSVY